MAADEAVLRIIMQDGGKSATQSSFAGTAVPIPTSATVGVPTATQPYPPPNTKPTPYKLSDDWMGKDDIYKMHPLDPAKSAKPPAKPPEPTPPPKSDWIKYKPPEPQFDPYEVAKKRREAQQREAQVDAAYKQMYGSKMDAVLDTVDKFRGVIGGVFGTFVGAIVDITSVIHKTRQQNKLTANATTPASALPRPSVATVGGTEAEGATSNTGAVEGVAGSATGVTAGAVAAVVAIAVVAVVKVAQALVGALDKAEKRYAQYSPVIAQAHGIADIQRVMGDLRRAQEIGPEMAKYVKARVDLEQKYEDVKVKLLTKLVPIATAIFDILEKGLDLLSPVFEVLADILKAIGDIYNFLVGKDERDRKPLPDSPIDAIFKQPGRGGILVPQV